MRSSKAAGGGGAFGVTYLALSFRGKVVLLSNIDQFDEVTWQRCTNVTLLTIRISNMITGVFLSTKINEKADKCILI